MPKTFTTSGLSAYLEQNIADIEAVRKEVEEIQAGFQTRYVEWKSKHDAELLRLGGLVVERLDETGAELQAQIQKLIPDEQEAVEERRKELREVIIPKYQQELDASIIKGQSKKDELRKLNPEINQKEEDLKAGLAVNKQELEKLNAQIHQRSRGLGSVLHFAEIGKLDGQRQRLIGRMEEQQKQLSKVRKDWSDYQQVVQQEQGDLQASWQMAIASLAQGQSELAILDDDPNREKMIRERATRKVLDGLKDFVECPAVELKVELDKMVEYNHQTDDYHDGLAAVAGLIGMLGSIQEGLRRFNSSVESLREQEKMYSSYLKPLEIVIPEPVLQFNNQWGELKIKVKDEKTICDHPAEFNRNMQPILSDQLSVDRITAMFDSLGKELKMATEHWT